MNPDNLCTVLFFFALTLAIMSAIAFAVGLHWVSKTRRIYEEYRRAILREAERRDRERL